MTKPPPDYLIFTDLETTGLDPADCGIVEAAMVTVETEHLNVIDHWSVLVDPVPFATRDLPRPPLVTLCDPAAYDLHVESGLADDWQHATLAQFPLAAGPDEMVNLNGLAMWISHTVARAVHDGSRASLAGASVHFDRDFLRYSLAGMREQSRLNDLGHRLFDTSVLRTAMQAWGSAKLADAAIAADESDRPHRALDDCYASLALARMARMVLIDGHPPGRRQVEDVELPEARP